MSFIAAWFRAFLWTLGIELVVANAVLRHSAPWTRRVSYIVIANVATHPAVWLIFPELGAGWGWPSLLTLSLSEVWAFGFEAFVYAVCLGPGQRRRAIAAAVAANAASFGLGFALRAWGLV